ncbi:MAG: hypothetical protein ACKVW3_03390 [Phycisphaerales bacterium]
MSTAVAQTPVWTRPYPTSQLSAQIDTPVGCMEADGSLYVAGTVKYSSTASVVRVVRYTRENPSGTGIIGDGQWPAIDPEATLYTATHMDVFANPSIDYVRVYVAGEVPVNGLKRVFVICFQANYTTGAMDLAWSKVIDDDDSEDADRQDDDRCVGLSVGANENYVAVGIDRKGSGRDMKACALNTSNGTTAFGGIWTSSGTVDDVPVGVAISGSSTSQGGTFIYIGGTTTVSGVLKYKIVGWQNGNSAQIANLTPFGAASQHCKATVFANPGGWSTDWEVPRTYPHLLISGHCYPSSVADSDYYTESYLVNGDGSLTQRWAEEVNQTGMDIPTAVMAIADAGSSESDPFSFVWITGSNTVNGRANVYTIQRDDDGIGFTYDWSSIVAGPSTLGPDRGLAVSVGLSATENQVPIQSPNVYVVGAVQSANDAHANYVLLRYNAFVTTTTQSPKWTAIYNRADYDDVALALGCRQWVESNVNVWSIFTTGTATAASSAADWGTRRYDDANPEP